MAGSNMAVSTLLEILENNTQLRTALIALKTASLIFSWYFSIIWSSEFLVAMEDRKTQVFKYFAPVVGVAKTTHAHTTAHPTPHTRRPNARHRTARPARARPPTTRARLHAETPATPRPHAPAPSRTARRWRKRPPGHGHLYYIPSATDSSFKTMCRGPSSWSPLLYNCKGASGHGKSHGFMCVKEKKSCC